MAISYSTAFTAQRFPNKDLLAAAKLSLSEAERLDAQASERHPVFHELLRGIPQSNIAIAEALACDEEEPDPIGEADEADWPEEDGDPSSDLALVINLAIPEGFLG